LKKKPSFKEIVSTSKQPQVASSPTNNEKPSWRLSLLELAPPFGWLIISKEKLIEVHQKLSQFESRTWNEILVTNKKSNHTIPIDNLCKEAQNRLEQIKQDDIEELVSLRLNSTERVFGIRDGSVLKIIWWDPDHGICQSEKAHT